MSGKRSYTTYAGRPSVGYKAARMIGGKVLRFNPSRPVAGSYRSRAQPAGGMLAAVRRAAEKKGVDTALTIAGPVIATTNTNGDSFVLNLIQQGAGSWNRVGRKVNLQSVRLRGTALYMYSETATTSDLNGAVLRMVVVWDKQPSGAAIPSFDTIFGVTAQDGTESCTFLNPVKFDNMDRFTVLKDCVIEAQPKTNNNGGGTTERMTDHYPFDEFIPLQSRETVFLGQSAPMTIADVSTGAVYVYFRSDISVDNTADWSISANSFARLRYTDL